MTVALVVPYSTDDPDRQRAWAYLEARYHTQYPTWEIVTGTCGGPWIKARAIEDALTKTDADLLVIADCDVWCEQTGEFVEKIEVGVWEWASPHRRIIRLNQETTEHVYRDGFPETMPNPRQLTQTVYDGFIGGGIVIVLRTLYERCPLDPRFVGWGGEDIAWGYSLLTMTRKRTQGRNVLWHLWHKPQERLTRAVGNHANEALKERYRLAAGDREKTEALIEEGRCHSHPFSSAPP